MAESGGVAEPDYRAAQLSSPFAVVLIDMLSDTESTLYRSLRLCDIFMFRRTCKEAWKCVSHEPLTARMLEQEGGLHVYREPHAPLLRFCLQNDLITRSESWSAIGRSGDAVLIFEAWEKADWAARYQIFFGAVRCAGPDVVLRLVEKGKAGQGEDVWDDDDFRSAVADGGSIEVAQAIDTDPTSWRPFIGDAMERNHEAFIHWVLGDAPPQPDEPFVYWAAKSGSVELVEWLVKRGWVPDSNAMSMVPAHHTAEMLDCLLAHGVTPDASDIYVAVWSDNHPAVEWFIAHGCELVDTFAMIAAGGGLLDMLKRLLRQGCPYDPVKLTTASCRSRRGPDTFLWLRSEGMAVKPELCMQEATVSGGVDPALIQSLFNVPLTPHHIRDSIAAGRFARLRHGLDCGAVVTVDDVAHMLECPASINELLRRHVADGRLDDEAIWLLDGAFAQLASSGSVAVLKDSVPKTIALLEGYGYTVD